MRGAALRAGVGTAQVIDRDLQEIETITVFQNETALAEMYKTVKESVVLVQGETSSGSVQGSGFVYNATVVDGQVGLVASGGTTSFDRFRFRTDDQSFPVTPPAPEVRIGDADLKISKAYGMLPATANGGNRTPADNQTVRNVFVIGPDKKIKLILVYPMSTGRNFDEILRVLDSLQLNAKHRVATPADWKQGEDVILSSAISNEEAKQLYPQGYKTIKPYLRVVPQPQ